MFSKHLHLSYHTLLLRDFTDTPLSHRKQSKSDVRRCISALSPTGHLSAWLLIEYLLRVEDNLYNFCTKPNRTDSY